MKFREHSSNPLFALLDLYELQYLPFADFTFLGQPSSVEDDLIAFARSSFSLLCMRTASGGSIVEIDRHSKIELSEVAESPVKFLDALLQVSTYYAEALCNYKTQGSKAAAIRYYTDECTKSAGGGRYKSFYHKIIAQ